jgi:apolipoprotein N-acyltransferase
VKVDVATRVVCVVAAIASLIIVCARMSGLQSSDLPFLAFVVAPYQLLGLMAGSVRAGTTAAWVLFIFTLFLSLGGMTFLGFNAPPLSTVPEPGLAQSVTMIGVLVLQFIAVSMLGLVLLLRRMTA